MNTTWRSLAPYTVCKFKNLLKYDVKLKKPNLFDLEWVYSAPCGEDTCQSWVFIDTSPAPDWGPSKKAWIETYIKDIGWNQIVNAQNKRFQCPSCRSHCRI